MAVGYMSIAQVTIESGHLIIILYTNRFKEPIFFFGTCRQLLYIFIN